MVGVTVTSHSALGAAATLAITGHPTVVAITVSRDLGDRAGRFTTLRGVPCFILDFVSAATAETALARLSAVSSRFTHKESPTRLACSGEVRYTLRAVRDFDDDAIDAIAAHYDDADYRYMAAQREPPHHGAHSHRHH